MERYTKLTGGWRYIGLKRVKVGDKLKVEYGHFEGEPSIALYIVISKDEEYLIGYLPKERARELYDMHHEKGINFNYYIANLNYRPTTKELVGANIKVEW